MFKNITSGYRKSSIQHLEEGGGGAKERPGGLFNLAKKMISVLHKELEWKVEKLKYKKLEVTQLRFETKSELPAGE